MVLATLAVSFSPSLTTAKTGSQPSGICPYFQSILPELKKARSRNFEIPGIYRNEEALVPGILVEDAPGKQCSLTLILAPGCPGATACSTGHYLAVPNGKASELRPDPKLEKPVKLAKGIQGYFYDAAKYCMTGCDSTISWQLGNVFYSVGIKYGTLQEVQRMANDVILGKPMNRQSPK